MEIGFFKQKNSRDELARPVMEPFFLDNDPTDGTAFARDSPHQVVPLGKGLAKLRE